MGYQVLNEEEISKLRDEAKVLMGEYDAAGYTGYKEQGGLPFVMLRVLEMNEGVIVKQVRLHGAEIHLVARKGSLSCGGNLPNAEPTLTNGDARYTLPGFKTSGLVGRFADEVCDIVTKRANHGSPSLRDMMRDAPGCAGRTKLEIKRKGKLGEL